MRQNSICWCLATHNMATWENIFLATQTLGTSSRIQTYGSTCPLLVFGTVFNLPSSDMLRDHYSQLKPRIAATYSRASSMIAMLIQFETFTCTRKTSGASTGLKPAGAPCRYALFSLLKISILRIHVHTPEKKDHGLNCPSICKMKSSRSSPGGRIKAACARKKACLSQVRRAWPENLISSG